MGIISGGGFAKPTSWAIDSSGNLTLKGDGTEAGADPAAPGDKAVAKDGDGPSTASG